MTKNVDELDISRFSSVEEYNRYFMEVYQLDKKDERKEKIGYEKAN